MAAVVAGSPRTGPTWCCSSFIERTVIVIGAVDTGENPRSRRPAASCNPQGVWRARGRREAPCGRRVLPHGLATSCPPVFRNSSTTLSTNCVHSNARANRRARSAGARLLLDPVGQLGDLRVDRPALGHQRADLPVGVDDGGVVAAAELLADLGQGQVGELPA